jgi:AcrR family transcriptional regulator
VNQQPVEQRLEALLRTACDVILTRGLPHTRTADVATAAAVSPALIFYHFESKERLLACAYAYAVERDLAQLDQLLASSSTPMRKLRAILAMYAATDRSKAWAMWIDGWAESRRMADVEAVSRRLDLHWKQGLADVIEAGVNDSTFTCDDPRGAAWRIIALIDGLAVQLTAHDNIVSRPQVARWIRLTAARELGITDAELT